MRSAGAVRTRGLLVTRLPLRIVRLSLWIVGLSLWIVRRSLLSIGGWRLSVRRLLCLVPRGLCVRRRAVSGLPVWRWGGLLIYRLIWLGSPAVLSWCGVLYAGRREWCGRYLVLCIADTFPTTR